MGLFVNQESNRTELQKRLQQELSDKAKKKAEHNGDMPDGVDDSAYIENTKQTTSLAWVWILIIAAVVVIAVWFFIASGNKA
ncbi:MAG: hypothetical protein JWN75_495 [Candidatus Saccharibacteria bacterium]|nr:hypothetical protein [Candidatus Saccharibacteria bacterium]